MNHKFNILGIVLLCTTLGCHALTLGSVRGAVLVGQPLNIVVPVQMDAGEDASTLCFDADVFHADTRQDVSRVRVLFEATGQANSANVRVMSSATIDEPVVTVYLRTGCGQKTTRRYVLLADMESEVFVPQQASQVALPAPAAVIPRAASTAGQAARAKQVVRDKAGRSFKSIERATQADKRTNVNVTSATTRLSQSRLKLDPLDDLSDRVANLDAYMTFAPPEDALRSFQKMQALGGDVKILQALAVKNEASLLDLKTRLRKAESERFPLLVVYGLIALVLACGAALAYFWNRQRRMQVEAHEWWSGSHLVPDSLPPEPPRGSAPESTVVSKRADELVAPPPLPVSVMDGLSDDSELLSEPGVDLMEMSESEFNHLIQSAGNPRASRNPDAFPAQAGIAYENAAHLLISEDIQDVRQQAEFFVSLGQTDRALRILKKQIDEADEPNPFVYLDLLSLFYSLSLKVDFQMLRVDFNRRFKGKVPEFSYFKKEGRDLDSYPAVLSRISAIWPKHSVLDVIDECIFRHPGAAPMQAFDLTAFRELLFLNDIAQSVALFALSDSGGHRGGVLLNAPDRTSGQPAVSNALDLDLSAADVAVVSGGTIMRRDLIEFNLPAVPTQTRLHNKN